MKSVKMSKRLWNYKIYILLWVKLVSPLVKIISTVYIYLYKLNTELENEMDMHLEFEFFKNAVLMHLSPCNVDSCTVSS